MSDLLKKLIAIMSLSGGWKIRQNLKVRTQVKQRYDIKMFSIKKLRMRA
jgi:hypothetical protein